MILRTKRTTPAIKDKTPKVVSAVEAELTPAAVSRLPRMIKKRPYNFFARRT